jgi:hypothetical protein
MKDYLSTGLVLIMLPLGSHAFMLPGLDSLLNMLFQPVLNRGCTAATGLLGNVAQFTCKCEGTFSLSQFGFTGGVDCATPSNAPICWSPQVCGKYFWWARFANIQNRLYDLFCLFLFHV